MNSILANEPGASEQCSNGIERIIEKKAEDYRVRISYADDRMCQRLEILKHDRVVFQELGIDNHYFLGNEWDDRDKRFLMSLTGQGTQLVISKWTGGAHCCNSLLIFDVKGKFKKIADIYGGNYGIEIVDLNHDGIPVIRLTDDFLAYRFSSFASSAQATVVLKFNKGQYTVAPELMKRPAYLKSFAPVIPRWRKLLREHANPDWPPPPFIQAMTDLLFTGNEGLAYRLVDNVWPVNIPGKADFLKSYHEALANSQYYAEFKGHSPARSNQ
jgi:hypothetical protein